jgi:anti-anti-sigma regulatory factor
MTGGGESGIERAAEEQQSSLPWVVERPGAGVTVIRATGDLDEDTGSQLHLLVADELLREPAQLVLELSNLVSVDDAVVDALVSASAAAGESDISFCLVASLASPVLATLAEASLIERFEVFPTVRAATGDR